MGVISKIIELVRPEHIYKSAITGKIVSSAYAKDNPETTYRMKKR
jgi:hypothetical protein